MLVFALTSAFAALTPDDRDATEAALASGASCRAAGATLQADRGYPCATVPSGSAVRALTIDGGQDAHTVVDGFTLTGGDATRGGGLWLSEGTFDFNVPRRRAGVRRFVRDPSR